MLSNVQARGNNLTPPDRAPEGARPARVGEARPRWRRVDPGHRPAETHVTAPGHLYLSCKVVVEFVLALGMLVFLLPVILLVAGLVKLTSAGPAFYSQTRLGKGGRRFRIYKVRTMTHDCEKVGGARWSTGDDPRVTPLGRFLRRTHLDELPQLWNVLKGDMSLVGPRPERPEFVPALEQALPHYRGRLLVRPGVTGLAQVQLPPDSDIGSVRRKLAYDLYYVRNAGPWLDVRLLACTAVHVAGVPYHVLGRLFGIPRQESVEHAYKHYPAVPKAPVFGPVSPYGALTITEPA